MIRSWIGIIFAAFIIITIASSMFRENIEQDIEKENQVFQPQAVEKFSIGEPVMVSGLSYKITNASVSDSLPAANLWEESQGDYMLITMFVENLSKEPKSELKKSDFALVDSEDRKFIPIKSLSLFFGESWGILQPDLGGYRGVVFQIPFDGELEYKLLVGGNKIVQLGMGKDLNIVE